MACPETRIQPEPPLPLADYFSRVCKACIDCAHCRDDGHPHKPERWLCMGGVDEAEAHLCHVARNMPHLCGIGGKWFRLVRTED